MAVRLGLIGMPVGHSRSPAIFSWLGRRLRRDVAYEALEVARRGLARALARLGREGWRGVNVTIPHKEAAARLCDCLTPDALAIGAANCLRFSGGAAKGHNTDWSGFLDALNLAGFKPAGHSAVVFGAGGAARAVGYALGRAGAASVTFAARRPLRARALARMLQRFFPATEFGAGRKAHADIIINATPLGMKGMGDRSPAPRRADCRLAVDLVYGRKTPFLTDAEASGAAVQDGLPMLVFQALRSWEFWFGGIGLRRRRLLAGDLMRRLRRHAA